MHAPSGAASFATKMTRGFLGTERGSVPLPVSSSRSRFGTVFRQAYRQALTGLSWLSYSPSRLSRAIAGLVSPVSPVARLKAPHAGQVARSSIRNSQAPCTGLDSALAPLHPLWSMTALMVKTIKVFPHRPRFARVILQTIG